ncbi:MAG: hypothetical protein CM1200mP20_09330 [Pseudomonadota bacterium]|nr:MAG: hypothetical protein CM1200mP20_09330 [Pseudomonadota bacterium]
MNSYQPVASHVAVRNGRVLGVGSLEDLAGWGIMLLTTALQTKSFCQVLWKPTVMPWLAPPGITLSSGFLTGEILTAACGPVSRPSMAFWGPLKEIENSQEDPEETLVAWGFDPIYFTDGIRMTVAHLDKVSRDRRIMVQHSNGHLLNVSRKVLELAGIDENTDVEGVMKDADGHPTGELGEMAAQYMAYRVTEVRRYDGINAKDLRSFARVATDVGVTTATDLHARVDNRNVRHMSRSPQRQIIRCDWGPQLPHSPCR